MSFPNKFGSADEIRQFVIKMQIKSAKKLTPVLRQEIGTFADSVANAYSRE
jgi:hypothetical protein